MLIHAYWSKKSTSIKFFYVGQESKKDEESMKTWVYFSAMDSFLSCEGEMAAK
jgi:hypothetical protein